MLPSTVCGFGGFGGLLLRTLKTDLEVMKQVPEGFCMYARFPLWAYLGNLSALGGAGLGFLKSSVLILNVAVLSLKLKPINFPKT